MIECGGSIELASVLTPSANVRVYVFDSHRPYNLSNVFATDWVRSLRARAPDASTRAPATPATLPATHAHRHTVLECLAARQVYVMDDGDIAERMQALETLYRMKLNEPEDDDDQDEDDDEDDDGVASDKENDLYVSKRRRLNDGVRTNASARGGVGAATDATLTRGWHALPRVSLHGVTCTSPGREQPDPASPPARTAAAPGGPPLPKLCELWRVGGRAHVQAGYTARPRERRDVLVCARIPGARGRALARLHPR